MPAHKKCSTYFEKVVGTLLRAGTRPVPACGRLGKKVFFILCASAQFYVPWYDYYFMRVSAILCKAIFVIGRLLTDRGGVEVTEQTASLLAKAAPSLQHHSSIGS